MTSYLSQDTALGSDATKANDMYVELAAGFAAERQTFKPFYPDICTIDVAKTRKKRWNWAECLAQVREFLGERVYNKMKLYSYELQVRDWESSLEWRREDLNDDETGSIQMGINGFPKAFLREPDNMLTRFMNHQIAGTTTEFGTGFDSVVAFSAAHTWGADAVYTTNQSNLFSGSNAGKIDLTYGYDNIQAGWQKLTGGIFGPDSNGVTGQIVSTPTHLLCSTSVYFNACRLLNVQEQIGGSTATYGAPGRNLLANLGITPVWIPGLTSGYAVLCDLSAALRFAIFLDRRDFELEYMGPGTYPWFNNRMARAGAWHRFNIGQGWWPTAVAYNGT